MVFLLIYKNRCRVAGSRKEFDEQRPARIAPLTPPLSQRERGKET